MKNRIAVAAALAASIFACTGAGDRRTSDTVEPAAPATAAPPLVPGALQNAHDAYLDGDFVALGEHVRDVLLDAHASDLVKENAYALLDKAYEVRSGNLPSRFVLPAGFDGIKYGVVHGMSQQQPFSRIYLYGNTRDASKLKGVSVRLLPDQTLLDSAASQGTMVLRHDRPGYDTFVVERLVPELPGDGVLSLRFDFVDGTSSEGWFIAHSLVSSATPELRTPAPGASFSETHPVVSWTPFQSPEFASYERRTLSVWAGLEGADGVAWDYWTQDYGDLATVRIGAHPPARSTSLSPGDYWLNITCGEARGFGPVTVARESRTVSPFHVVP